MDWLAWGMYTLVLCAEMEVGKSAIYALLSRCRECRDLRALGAKKNVNPGIRARKTEIPALFLDPPIPNYSLSQPKKIYFFMKNDMLRIA